MMLCDLEAGVLGGGGDGLCEVAVGEEGTVGRADDAGAPRGPTVLLGRRSPAVDHRAGDRAVQLTCAGRWRLVQSTQSQSGMHGVLMCWDKCVRVSLVDQGHLGVRLVPFLIILQIVRVQTQGPGDVAVRVQR